MQHTRNARPHRRSLHATRCARATRVPSYGLVWLEIAREQLDARIEQLLESPRRHSRSAYDEATDQWTTTYGGGAGLIVYAVVHDRLRLIILRLL